MNSRFEKQVEACQDGALSPAQRRRIERRIAEDVEAQEHARSTQALSRMIREAWTEGPASPPPERFLAAIRPELQRIDAERARAAAEAGLGATLRELLRSWGSWLRPVPMAAGAALAATAAVLLSVDLGSVSQPPALERRVYMLPQAPVPAPTPARDVALDQPFATQSAIYDLHQGDASLLIYDGEDDSPLVIFAVPDVETEDDVSSLVGGIEIAALTPAAAMIAG